MRTQTMRWSAGTAALCALLMLATWFLLISPRRAQVSDLKAQQVSAQQTNDQLRTKLEQLKVEFAQLPTVRARLEEIRRQLPPTADVPALVRTLDAIATSSGVGLLSVAPGAPQSLAKTGAAGASSGASTTGVVSIPVGIVVTGDYFQAVAFLRQLQTGMPRAFLVTGLQIAQGSGNKVSGVQVTITGAVFSLPDATSATSSGATGATSGTVAGTTPGATPTPGATSGATSTPGATSGATSTPGATSGSTSAATPAVTGVTS